MKNENWMLWLRKLLVPGMLALLGFALVVAPDWAAALASKVLGGVLIAWGVFGAIITITGWPKNGAVRVIVTVMLLGVGIYLSKNPLAVATGFGKVIGVYLFFRSGMSMLEDGKRNVLSSITMLAGLFLVLFPLTLSRLVIRIIGGILLLVNIGNILAIRRMYKLPGMVDDPNIIDAEP